MNTGQALAHYEIIRPLGKGGMGEVYLAQDTKLKREVAIKVLPESVRSDEERLRRFRREAEAAAKLNHSNIAHIYTLENVDDLTFIVMEYVDGKTLSELIPTEGMDLNTFFKIFILLADALSHAHGHGRVHRDLKPGNIMITSEGTPKILDFGLAHIIDPDPVQAYSASETTPELGPDDETRTMNTEAQRKAAEAAVGARHAVPSLTRGGQLIGTPAYMSPEQIEGKKVDARTDIFSFGIVMYEAITGQRPFQGENIESIIGRILTEHPLAVTELKPVTSYTLWWTVRKCLEKDPEERTQTARELYKDLQSVHQEIQAGTVLIDATQSVDPSIRQPSISFWRHPVSMVLLLVIALLIIFVAIRDAGQVVQGPFVFDISAPNNDPLPPTPKLAVSPDGRHVVFVTDSGLWLRSFDSAEARLLPGTENAVSYKNASYAYPFWSPDSRFIGFFDEDKLIKLPISGGPPIVLCDAPEGMGGTWNNDNIIVFSGAPNTPLQQVSAAGGTPTQVTTLDTTHTDTRHFWPHFLPDGQRFIFYAIGNRESAELKIGSLDSDEIVSLSTVNASSMAAYASGHLFYWHDDILLAQPFDTEQLRTVGDPFPVANRVFRNPPGYASFSVSPSGVLVYASGDHIGVTSELTWIDRTGKQLGTLGDPDEYRSIAMTHDDQHLAVSLLTGRLSIDRNTDIWQIDLSRSVSERLTFDPGSENNPIWSPDGSSVVFYAYGTVPANLYIKGVNSNSQQEALLDTYSFGPNEVFSPSDLDYPTDWSMDGKSIVYAHSARQAHDYDLWILPLTAQRKPFPFLQTPFNETDGVFSPDGRFLAYSSDESGRYEVYVQPFPATGERWRISHNGGVLPTWRSDGRELFLKNQDNTFMAIEINTSDSFDAGIPQVLFTREMLATVSRWGRRQYEVSADGQRFLVNIPQQRPTETTLTVVVNWPATITK